MRESFVTGKLKIQEHRKLTDGLDGGANNVHYESDGSEVVTSLALGAQGHKKSLKQESPGKKSKKRSKVSPTINGSRNEALLPNVSEQYESNTHPSNLGKPSSRKNSRNQQSSIQSQDQVNGFTVFVGKDIFTKFESPWLHDANLLKKRASSPKVTRDRSNLKRLFVIENQVFHGNQQTLRSKADLIQSKKESRALKKAKNQQ